MNFPTTRSYSITTLNLPKDTDDHAWVTLASVPNRTQLDRLVAAAAELYGFSRTVTIGGINRTRIERTFDVAMFNSGIPRDTPPTREAVFLYLAAYRLAGGKLPAPLDHFKP